MVINVLIVAFILLMAYWWALQGLFSAWLHLCCVIVSGAIALALWEPMAYMLLGTGSFAAYNAWGVGLLAPFGVTLIVSRVAMDRLVPMNLNFPDLANKIGGAVLGLFAGTFTAGIAIMGILFLPLGESVGGLQPYRTDLDGSVIVNEGGGLWYPVDRITAKFYRELSGGAFYAGHPMSLYLPDMAKAAGGFRLHPDANSSLIAVPQAVSVVAAYSHVTPVEALDGSVVEALAQKAAPGKQMVLIDTRWKVEPRGSFDTDSTLRLSPAGVKLITTPRNGGDDDTKEYAPVAISRQERTADRQFFAIKSHDTLVTSNRAEDQLAMMFIIAADEQPRFLYVRQLRLDVPQPETDEAKLAAMVGKMEEPAVVDASDRGPTAVGARQGLRVGAVGVEIKIDPKLPTGVSKNLATAFSYTPDNLIMSGSREVAFVPSISQALRADALYEAPNRAIVRMQIDADRSATVANQARGLAGALNPPMLRDNFGEDHYAIGYVLFRPDKSQVIHVDRTTFIRAATQLPLREMNAGDELYLYFDIGRERGRLLTSFEIGPMKQELEPGLPVE